MKTFKISLDDLEVMRKYRVQTRNYYVSSEVEGFTCGANLVLVKEGQRMKDNTEFGISKKEHKISYRVHVCRYLGNISGGS